MSKSRLTGKAEETAHEGYATFVSVSLLLKICEMPYEQIAGTG